MSPEMAVCPIENLSSILMRFILMLFPLHMRSLRQRPPDPWTVSGVRAEQSNTGLAGVEMDDALNTTRHGMKYMTGWPRISSCCSFGRSLRKDTCPFVKSLSIAFTISRFVSSSLW